jgi:alkylglycerol monooxygenase
MEQYAKLILIAMPLFLALVIIEKLYGKSKGNDTSPWRDSISSLSSGMTNVIKDALGISISIISYEVLLKHMALFTIENSLLIIIIAFIAIDFHGYWTHRICHNVNIFWNIHVIHHSSEEFNLACALRQSISSFINVFTFLLIPAALIGIPSNIIAIILPLHLFMQFWYHTRHIKKMGWLEYIIVTPSTHRVHHAMNKEYMNKNLGQIFIFWDMLFGTYQKELDEVEPIYGVTRPAATWNPIKINFQHIWILIKDAWRAPKLWDKIRIWFMPTGWRPKGFPKRYPIKKIKDVYNFKKYQSTESSTLTIYSCIHLVIAMMFIMHFFYDIAVINTEFGFTTLLLYGGYLFALIYCLTDLMDNNPYAWVFEAFRTAYAVLTIIYLGSWFGLDSAFTWIIIIYQLLSLLISIVFTMYLSSKQNKFVNL